MPCLQHSLCLDHAAAANAIGLYMDVGTNETTFDAPINDHYDLGAPANGGNYDLGAHTDDDYYDLGTPANSGNYDLGTHTNDDYCDLGAPAKGGNCEDISVHTNDDHDDFGATAADVDVGSAALTHTGSMAEAQLPFHPASLEGPHVNDTFVGFGDTAAMATFDI